MGVYTRMQLEESGIGRSGITRRMRSGSMIRLLPGIYSDPEPSYYDLCLATTLWREDAVLSHLSAAWLWDLLDTEPTVVHVTLSRDSRINGPGWLKVHRRSVSPEEHRGFLVVSAVQCFVDVAAAMQGLPLEQFFDRCISSRVSWRDVTDHCESAKGMTGMREVRRQLEKCCPGTWSEPERLVARAVLARGIRMEINMALGRYIVDLACRPARVIVEIDGRQFHIDPRTFDNDRVRQNTMVLDGWLVLRFSAATVNRDLDRVADQIAAVVRRRRKSRGA